ncbi:MAG TPA: type II toxin-antitoxin system death-on-curing family toxin [Verrucomicrobiota bacterium]|nr:type II toxin-antitoxin system death-on-curing family toxin [Verrucomicrobiota bacterium]
MRLHARGLELFGGQAGVREPGLVESAVASAQNTYWYGDGTRFDIAASYAFHFAESQASLDGNKRVAISAALAFLHANEVLIPADPKGLHEAMIAIAKHELDKRGLAQLLLHKHLESCASRGVSSRYIP